MVMECYLISIKYIHNGKAHMGLLRRRLFLIYAYDSFGSKVREHYRGRGKMKCSGFTINSTYEIRPIKIATLGKGVVQVLHPL